MSGIVLSAATRQSLLAAQDTTALLASTQNKLATGKKVNSALDNPTNFFTASALDNRASDLSSLLDSMSNGIQTIQAADKGITSIQNLVQNLKSTVAQARQDNSADVTPGTATALTGPNTSSTPASAITFAVGGGVTVSISTYSGSAVRSDVDIANDVNNNTALAGKVKAKIDASGKVQFQNLTGTAINTTGIGANAIDGTTTSTGTLAAGAVGKSTVRQSLSQQFNELLGKIDDTAKDSGYNGVNLLAGDKLKLNFNEKGTSTYTIGAKNADNSDFGTLNAAALGLSNQLPDQFQDNSILDGLTTKLNTALTTLRTQASSYGSSLSIVQGRQDFTKGIINVLQTGSSNLVNADLNEEAANSQALSTRQSLAISSLSLANQAQQGVLQLLR